MAIVEGIGTAAGKATVHGAHYKPSRIIVGRLPSDAYGMRVSIPGYDASSHPVDDQKLIFSSEWPDVMPIHARGSFVHRSTTNQGNTVTQEIDMPSPLGYVPFCDFTVRGNGDALPAGTDLYPSDRYYPYGGMSLFYWDGSGNVTTAGDANAYLRLNVTATKICARSFVRWISGSSTQGIPRTWTIYYTIYRKQAS